MLKNTYQSSDPHILLSPLLVQLSVTGSSRSRGHKVRNTPLSWADEPEGCNDEQTQMD